jgi:hypothetical protein
MFAVTAAHVIILIFIAIGFVISCIWGHERYTKNPDADNFINRAAKRYRAKNFTDDGKRKYMDR